MSLHEEKIKELFNNAKIHMKNKNYQQAIINLKQVLENSQDNSNENNKNFYLIFQNLAQCYFQIKQYNESLQYCQNTIEAINSLNDTLQQETFKSQLIEIFFLRKEIYKQKQAKQMVIKELNYIKEFIGQDQNNLILYQDQYQECINELKLLSQESDQVNGINGKIIEQQQQCKYVQDLFSEENYSNYLTTEGIPVYVIDMNWFKKWKKYVKFGSKRKLSDTLEKEVDGEHPGPILNDILIDKDANILIETQQDKQYANIKLIDGLRENHDYVIVSYKIGKYLHQIYGGQQVKRYIISVTDEQQSLTQVEIQLKMVQVALAPSSIWIIPKDLTQASHIFRLYQSRKYSLKDIKDKLLRVFKNDITKFTSNQSYRIWKINMHQQIHHYNHYKLDEILQKMQENAKLNKYVKIDGILLNEKNSLEENDIDDKDDVLLFEWKTESDWILINEELCIDANCCANCGNKQSEILILKQCQCLKIKYCDMSCLIQHRGIHKIYCQKMEGQNNKQHSLLKKLKITPQRQYNAQSKRGLTGLQNLGNTCFMNSILQCLSNTMELTNYFLQQKFIEDIDINNKLGTGGVLAAQYGELLKDMWFGDDDYLSCWDFKKAVAKLAPQFYGFQQQDAHELLSYLLDGLHEDQNKVLNKPQVPTREENMEDSIKAKLQWNDYLKRNQSIIVDTFAGQLKSTLVCPDCKKISVTFDPYFSLPLPVPHIKLTTFSFYLIFRNSYLTPLQIQQTFNSQTTVKQLKDFILNNLLISQKIENIQFHYMIQHKTQNPIPDFKTIEDLKQKNENIFAIEMTNNEQDFLCELDFGDQKSLQFYTLELEIRENDKYNISNIYTFSRFLKVPSYTNFKHIHLHIYRYLRPYLKQILQNPGILKEQIQDKDIDTIQKEYEEIFLKENAYSVQFHQNKKNTIIEYSEKFNMKEFLQEFGMENDSKIVLAIQFIQEIQMKKLNLNKCQDLGNLDKQKLTAHFQSNLNQQCKVSDCLDLFTKQETLDEKNEWYCPNCKKHQQADKQLEIYSLPQILIIHLKRFKTTKVSSFGNYFFQSGGQKVNTFVEFPIKNFNLTQYAISAKQQLQSCIYDLFAVSNHYGGMGGGHYTAVAYNSQYDKWFNFNDSMISSLSKQDEICSDAAYLLFYRKIDSHVSHI